MGAVVTTLSGQVRSKGTGAEPDAGLPPGTSSAKVRYRLTGIDVPRWVFQAGWPGCGSPAGVEMVRADVNASGESGEGFEKVVTVIAPGRLRET
jgi:hypothetical protein